MNNNSEGTGVCPSLFVCPVCGQTLLRQGHVLKCGAGHSFDVARSGYVNLIAGRAPRLEPDSREMVRARVEFFSRGRYAELKSALGELADKYCRGTLLDAGCGEGYFIEHAAGRFSAAGVDLSKFAADAAAKRLGGRADIAVANVYRLPLSDGSVSLVQNVFSPYCGSEFRRVLSDDGTLVVVSPGARHLWELKDIVYDTPPVAAPREHKLDGFELVEELAASGEEQIDSADQLRAMFMMTPHSRSQLAHPKRLEAVGELSVTTEFDIAVYQKM